MDYFTEERIKQAEEVIQNLPDTIYTVANFAGSLTKEQVQEYRQAVKSLRLVKDSKLHRAYKNIIKLGMNTLRKATANIGKRGFSLCEGTAGCNQCCRQLVIIWSKAEQAAISNEIKVMPLAIKQLLADNLNRREPKQRSAMLAFGVTDEKAAEDLRSHVGRCFSEIGGMCPAVGPTGTCMIYPVRPWSCRTYRILGHQCVAGQRVNIVDFADIQMAIQDLLNKSGAINLSIFHVIRQALDL